MLTIAIEAFNTLPLLMLFRIGVDAWRGLVFSGLVKDDKSGSMENWFVVLSI